MLKDKQIYQVHHLAFATDDLKSTTSLVEASSKEEALDKYNAQALIRKEYPYMWNVVTIENVFLPEIIW